MAYRDKSSFLCYVRLTILTSPTFASVPAGCLLLCCRCRRDATKDMHKTQSMHSSRIPTCVIFILGQYVCTHTVV